MWQNWEQQYIILRTYIAKYELRKYFKMYATRITDQFLFVFVFLILWMQEKNESYW